MEVIEYKMVNGKWGLVEESPLNKLTREQRRALIFGMQDEISKLPDVFYGDTDNCPLTHKFAPGVYVREIFIPKGMLLVGKIHKHAHPNFLMKGEVSVLTEEGGIERLKAPLSMISPPGTKRVVFAHEDTVWTTIHVTDKTDLKEIEHEIIAKDYFELEQEEKKCLGQQ